MSPSEQPAELVVMIKVTFQPLCSSLQDDLEILLFLSMHGCDSGILETASEAWL